MVLMLKTRMLKATKTMMMMMVVVVVGRDEGKSDNKWNLMVKM